MTKLLEGITLLLPQKLGDQWKESIEGWWVHRERRRRRDIQEEITLHPQHSHFHLTQRPFPSATMLHPLIIGILTVNTSLTIIYWTFILGDAYFKWMAEPEDKPKKVVTPAWWSPGPHRIPHSVTSPACSAFSVAWLCCDFTWRRSRTQLWIKKQVDLTRRWRKSQVKPCLYLFKDVIYWTAVRSRTTSKPVSTDLTSVRCWIKVIIPDLSEKGNGWGRTLTSVPPSVLLTQRKAFSLRQGLPEKIQPRSAEHHHSLRPIQISFRFSPAHHTLSISSLTF